MKFCLLVGLALVFVLYCEANLTDSCIACIGKVEGGSSGCNWDVNSNSCGKYQIKKPYWTDCGKLGSSWESCAADDACARRCMKAYMSRYGFICRRALNKASLSCLDYGRLHNGGPYGCSNSNTDSYVQKMKRSCGL